eukprot:215231-Pelagomonas_calceolata.AAC.8
MTEDTQDIGPCSPLWPFIDVLSCIQKEEQQEGTTYPTQSLHGSIDADLQLDACGRQRLWAPGRLQSHRFWHEHEGQSAGAANDGAADAPVVVLACGSMREQDGCVRVSVHSVFVCVLNQHLLLWSVVITREFMRKYDGVHACVFMHCMLVLKRGTKCIVQKTTCCAVLLPACTTS